MADTKLGTSVTYKDPAGKKKPVKVQGISFPPDKAVQLNELLPQPEAEKLAQRLSLNSHFQVEGGPDHSTAREDLQAARFKHEQDVQAAFRRNQDRRRPAPEAEPEAPDNYVAPESNALEGDRPQNARRVAPEDVAPKSSRKS